MECLICFSDLSENDYLELECCNSKIHITCMQTWIQKNKHTNTDIDKCIFCKKSNDIINNLLYQPVTIPINDSEIIEPSRRFIVPPPRQNNYLTSCLNYTPLCTIFFLVFILLTSFTYSSPNINIVF